MRTDLNLLTVFDAIMTELNLTAAARRVGKTPSAISHSLRRLRELTGDTLFERTGRGVRPTPRALEMEREVRRALQIIQGTLHGRSAFDLTSERRTFLIDIPAGFDWLVAPRLAARLGGAPGISLRISNARAGSILDEPRYRDTWLALDYVPMHADGFRSETIYEDEIVLIARRGHPSLTSGARLDELRRIGQVGIGWASGGPRPVNHPIDERLQAANMPRTVQLWVPTLATMIAVVEGSDLVAYVAARTARRFAPQHAIEIHKLPSRVRTGPIVMVWSTTFDADAGHRWLRETVREVCNEP